MTFCSTSLLPEIETQTYSKPGSDDNCLPTLPPNITHPKSQVPGPGPQVQTPTDCQSLQALAVLRWDGVPNKRREACQRQPRVATILEGPCEACVASGRHMHLCTEHK